MNTPMCCKRYLWKCSLEKNIFSNSQNFNFSFSFYSQNFGKIDFQAARLTVSLRKKIKQQSYILYIKKN